MRIVIDCNIVVSAAGSKGVCADVVLLAVRHHDIILSEPILDECRLVAHRPKHAQYRHKLLSIIDILESLAILIEPVETVFGLNDPDDEIYLATALAGEAILITGNSKDFQNGFMERSPFSRLGIFWKWQASKSSKTYSCRYCPVSNIYNPPPPCHSAPHHDLPPPDRLERRPALCE
ncbi:MAG: putative toxin-antitoxin system toxin component, PIN family [Rhodospirillales bacterium]|jgi:putative PIN family toxin of toxin-antitoxin system